MTRRPCGAARRSTATAASRAPRPRKTDRQGRDDLRAEPLVHDSRLRATNRRVADRVRMELNSRMRTAVLHGPVSWHIVTWESASRSTGPTSPWVARDTTSLVISSTRLSRSVWSPSPCTIRGRTSSAAPKNDGTARPPSMAHEPEGRKPCSGGVREPSHRRRPSGYSTVSRAPHSPSPKN